MADTFSTSPGGKPDLKRGPGWRSRWVRPRTRAARRQARQDLHVGREPAPFRPRHSALAVATGNRSRS